MYNVKCVCNSKLAKERRHNKHDENVHKCNRKKKKKVPNEQDVSKKRFYEYTEKEEKAVNNFLTTAMKRSKILKHGKRNKYMYYFVLNKLNRNLVINARNNKTINKICKENIPIFMTENKLSLHNAFSNKNGHILHKTNRAHWNYKEKCFPIFAICSDTKSSTGTAYIVGNDQKYHSICNIQEKKYREIHLNAGAVVQGNNTKKKKKRVLSEKSKESMKEKLRIIMIQKWKDTEFRKKMIKSFKKRGIEHNKKISETLKNKWKNDKEYKLKTLEGQRKYFVNRYKNRHKTYYTSAETREKISKAMKLYWLNKNKYKQMQTHNLQSVVKKKKKHKKVWENIYSIILDQKQDDLSNYQTFHHNLSVNLEAALR
ncbi:hypothetical protein MKS88_001904 [Plasmodium brasilianum]|uniref:Uncharacterized protein n=2 Tax=Plasmodium (Plasmodium) TaxID=418103 RepID=A0A1A8VVI7_PLAMA|nr:conserved Plasmodium protein, unknown function [Plasmodium malariae]KAI4839355.1 hypothetical protein MKS88_001904 [Plasmodium brasilianum]SBS83699.1 conserved Plasmodium protein, unknown function [Plasmodium malariae]SBT87771.1 conserved Plasmodium protein, unknown function [Plasmodium malariae]